MATNDTSTFAPVSTHELLLTVDSVILVSVTGNILSDLIRHFLFSLSLNMLITLFSNLSNLDTITLLNVDHNFITQNSFDTSFLFPSKLI